LLSVFKDQAANYFSAAALNNLEPRNLLQKIHMVMAKSLYGYEKSVVLLVRFRTFAAFCCCCAPSMQECVEAVQVKGL
jgi:hypothetical protein